jgi:hypothetical protein
MAHPKTIGDRTMLAVMLALHDAGYTVLLPLGENTRYDLVIDDGSSLTRVQCKTGRLREGAVRFSTCSSYGHHERSSPSRRDYRGDVDWFAVHCSETEGVYLVPIDELSSRVEAALRVEPARNGQRSGIRPAARYELRRVAVGVRNDRARALV